MNRVKSMACSRAVLASQPNGKDADRSRCDMIDVGATETAACVTRRLCCIFPFGRLDTAKLIRSPDNKCRRALPGILVGHMGCVACTRASNSAPFGGLHRRRRQRPIRKRALGGLILMMVWLFARALGGGTRVLARLTVGSRRVLILPYF